MKIVLVTGHDYDSPRKTGFHFWADILGKRGWDVNWICAGQSLLSVIAKSQRPPVRPYNRWVDKTDRIKKYIWYPPVHPANFKNDFINTLTAPFFARTYAHMLPRKVFREIENADFIIVEVGAGLMIVEKLRKHCPNAKIIYTVSDRLKTLNAAKAIVDAEKKALPHFSRIRVPAAAMLADYSSPLPAIHIPQGIDKSNFDLSYENPYKSARNAISVGDMLFDAWAIETLARNFPDWTFHVFGNKARISTPMDNVIVYGEKPFKEITPYIVHADIALAPYRFEESAAYLAQSSLKMFQYSYCHLPIVAPDFAAEGRNHACGYAPNDDHDLVTAFEKAMAYDRPSISTDDVLDWNQVIDKMLDI